MAGNGRDGRVERGSWCGMNLMVGIGWSCGYPARAALEPSCCISDPVAFTGSEGGGPSTRPAFAASKVDEAVRIALARRAPGGALPARCLAMIPGMLRTLELVTGSLGSGSAGRESDVDVEVRPRDSFTAKDGK